MSLVIRTSHTFSQVFFAGPNGPTAHADRHAGFETAQWFFTARFRRCSRGIRCSSPRREDLLDRHQ